MKVSEKKLVESFNLNDELESAVFDFIDMRTMIKKPMTERAIKMCINKVLKMSDNDKERIAIIEQSIFHNWLDIYPLIRDDYMARRAEQISEKWTTVE